MMRYLAEIDALPEAERWARTRHYLFNEPLPFFAELREHRPVFALPELTLVTRFDDCATVLRRWDTFGVDLYAPKQGDYFMAQDNTPTHWRAKSIMKAILEREELPQIREFVEKRTHQLLKTGEKKGQGQIEAVSQVTRAVPIALVRDWFGLKVAKPNKLQEWSYWNQQDAFWNQPFDAVTGIDQEQVIANREKAIGELAIAIAKLVGWRALQTRIWFPPDNAVTRLVRLKQSGAVPEFGLKNVIQNAGGLLIGAVETTSHGVVNALSFLLSEESRATAAKQAAASGDPSAIHGFVYEALRFNPAFPYFFRVCQRPTPLGVGTPSETVIQPGTTVLAVTHSAMFDSANFPAPDAFDPARDMSDTFTFGMGHHQCLGVAIAGVMVPEICRQILRLPNLKAEGAPDFKGTAVPEEWKLTWG